MTLASALRSKRGSQSLKDQVEWPYCAHCKSTILSAAMVSILQRFRRLSPPGAAMAGLLERRILPPLERALRASRERLEQNERENTLRLRWARRG
jgi:hypothetical protein